MRLESESLRNARDRISRVFRYLEALNQHRNPAIRQIREQQWFLWLRDLPDHPAVRRGTIEALNPNGEGESRLEDREGDDFILKVRRPSLTQSPAPPEVLRDWLERGWEDPFREIRVRESRNKVDAQGETRIVGFEDDPERPLALQSWRPRRGEWARHERPARRAMRIFEELYELHGRIGREAERVELVLGDGILSWRRPEGGIYHPVLLQRLQLDFDPALPEFTIVETEHGVELYSALFRSVSDVDGKAIAHCRQELEQGGFHPLGDGATSGFFRRLVVQLSPRGEFTGDQAPRGEADDPRIGSDPVIFLRSRMLGFATAIEEVLEDLQQREDLPDSLLTIVGVEPAPEEEQQEETFSRKPWKVPEEILLSKEANPEQLRIADRLERHGCVLVQGPPGTGKTHTIANLIGHLLAQGKSVLVTSHASKALRVLRDHVVEQLRPLCVSVLERDIDSRRQLESSVEAIVERLSVSDSQLLEADAASLRSARRELLGKLEQLREEILRARTDEYRDVVILGQTYSPSDAARKVARETGESDWIPSPVEAGAGLPLSEAEVIDLYQTNADLGPEDEAELARVLPNPEEVPTPEEFERIITEKQELDRQDLDFRSDLWGSPPGTDGMEQLETLGPKFAQAAGFIDGGSWKLTVVEAGRNGGASREPWDNLLAMIRQTYHDAANSQETLVRDAPQLSGKMALDDQRRIAQEVLHHLRAGRKLGRLALFKHRSWKRFIQDSRVSAGTPSEAEHFRALIILADLQIARRELANRWDRQVGVLGAPSSAEFGVEKEKACWQLVPAISASLEWHANVWRPLEDSLKQLGFRWEVFLGEQPPNFAPCGELSRLRGAVVHVLPKVLHARASAIKQNRLEVKLADLARELALAGNGGNGAKAVAGLRDAVSRLDPDGYRAAFQRWVGLWRLRSRYQRRCELLERLEGAAPAWASAIRARKDRHGDGAVPGDLRSAWLWRQLYDELDRRSKVSLEQLERSAAKVSGELRRMTTDLVDRRAWAAQIRRTTLQQRQALIGWLDTVRKMGKGFGKRVPRLRAEAARKMGECRTAVPVWIMPLSRVVENFDPRATRFDVVIIDEASQSDVMALLAFYLARKVVIVGDHEQVSPTAVGQNLTVVQHLIDEHLEGIPNNQLYDGQMSVYDLARQSFGATICLLEHFRCVPEIIQFSNHFSYDGRIKPLRDPSSVSLKPRVISYRVGASLRDGKVNREEAWAVASLLVAVVEQPEYRGKTFGVVSLVGEEQAREIERLLLRHISPEEYLDRRILCGTAAQFQGDERDVMFLSVVDVASGGPLPLRDQQVFKQRFNVAASRARDQMWVVHSLDFRNDLKAGDLRKGLIEHAEDPLALVRALEKGEQRPESELEKAVLSRLVRAGYRVVPQWRVGYYRIDLVVEAGGKRLAIECDGDRYHPPEKLAEAMARQAVLERLGWTFSRIRGSEFFRDPEKTMESIFQRLQNLGIPPEGAEASTEPGLTGNELRERISRRAEQLRREWREGELPGFDQENGFEERKSEELATDDRVQANPEQPPSARQDT